MIAFPVGEGAAPGYLALPRRGEGPGILVLHAWWGLNDFFKAVCERLAQEGFVVLASDLYHGEVATTIEEAERLSGSLFSGTQAEADIAGAVAYLRQHPAVKGQGIGCVGFSLGAMYAFSTSCARPADVAAVVAFYGAGPEADYSAARAAFLGHYAEQDEWEPDEFVTKTETTLRAAGKDVTFYRYPGTRHWFFEEDRPDAYNAEAAALAWQRTVDFLRLHLVQA
ncbi:MAG TPA: dienelactone hydrolase family protein [Ktedonobacterales bacterium]